MVYERKKRKTIGRNKRRKGRETEFTRLQQVVPVQRANNTQVKKTNYNGIHEFSQCTQKSEQRQCAYFHMYDWPWLHYHANEINSYSADRCWLPKTDQQSIWSIRAILIKLTFRLRSPSGVVIFLKIYSMHFYLALCSPYWSEISSMSS
jgi:hypothetical protein